MTIADIEVQLIDSMGSDSSIVQAARVSVQGANHPTVNEGGKLINYLLKHKHGSPFEHNSMTFFVKAPIFVFREFQRHRIGFSYNEMSGRYTELPNEFYYPTSERPLINIGTSSHPVMAPAEPRIQDAVHDELAIAYRRAWDSYQDLLGLGIAKEVARLVLPVGIMSQMYVTCNARSLMHFLSLRTHVETAQHVSNPQYEIEMVAKRMEIIFADLFPVTYSSYNENKRVAP